jgi:hypothetical protein
MIFGRVAKGYIFDYCRYDGFIGISLITGDMMASWATIRLLCPIAIISFGHCVICSSSIYGF